MSSQAVTKETFDREVLASELPVMVDFWAPWCGPCHAVAPVLEQIASERSGALNVVNVNIDDEPELAVRFGVSSIPTILLFENGCPVAGSVGARNKQQLEKTLGLPALTSAPEPAQAPGLRGLLSRHAGERQ